MARQWSLHCASFERSLFRILAVEPERPLYHHLPSPCRHRHRSSYPIEVASPRHALVAGWSFIAELPSCVPGCLGFAPRNGEFGCGAIARRNGAS